MNSHRIAIGQPGWLFDPCITIREISEHHAFSLDTIASWLQISKAMGGLVPILRKHRRLFTGHQCYVIAVLIALSKSGVPINESIIRRAIAVTHKDGQPVLPGLFDVAEFAELGTDGQPVARIFVELSAVWIALEPKLAKLMEPAIA